MEIVTNYIVEIILAVHLLGIAIVDMGRKKISWIALGILGVLLLAAKIYLGEVSWWMGLDVVPGFLFLLLSYASSGCIGKGDGVLVSLLGLGIGIQKTLYVLMISFFAAALVAVVVLTLHKGSKKSTLPMVPFLLLGFLCVWGMGL